MSDEVGEGTILGGGVGTGIGCQLVGKVDVEAVVSGGRGFLWFGHATSIHTHATCGVDMVWYTWGMERTSGYVRELARLTYRLGDLDRTPSDQLRRIETECRDEAGRNLRWTVETMQNLQRVAMHARRILDNRERRIAEEWGRSAPTVPATFTGYSFSWRKL